MLLQEHGGLGLRLSAAILGGAICACLPIPTWADEPATSSAVAIPEIIVTAQKKAERAQEVGISITAIGAEDIVDLGIKDSTDVARIAPSVQFNRFSESDVVFNIRGVAQNDYGDQQEPPIAVYQDDSYASSFNLAGFPLFDTQRIEVLRGPQGTLFGRNATGGAIQFISNKPTEDFESQVTVTGGSYGEADATAAVSGPLRDGLQGRFALDSVQHGAYLTNIAPGQGDRGSVKQLAARGELAFQPGGDFTGLLTIRFAHDGPETSGGMYAFVPTYLDPVTGTGDYLTANSANPNPWGTCKGCDATGYRNDSINPYLGGDPWTIHSYGPVDLDRTITGASLHLEDHVGGVVYVSISDFQHLNKFYEENDFGNGGLSVIDFAQRNVMSQFTQELRASGDAGPNSWVAGAYYMRVVGDYSGYYAEPFFDYYPYAAFTQDTTSAAIFSQDELKFGDGWKLIAGLRFWRDQRTLDYSVHDNTGNYPPSNPIMVNSTDYPGIADKIFQDYSAKLELDRQLSSNLLTYLSFNRGTKSGGFEASVATPSAGAEQAFINSIPYGTERLNDFELGVKSTLLDNRLRINGDVFYYDYAGFQGFEQIGVVQAIKNLNAREWGMELEVESRPASGLTLSAALSSLHSVLYNVTEPSLVVVDTYLPQAPKLSGNAMVRYEHPIGLGVASVQLTGRFWDNFCWSVFCGQVDIERPGYASDGRLSYETGPYLFAFGVTNLTNRIYRVYEDDTTAAGGQITPIFAPPRWYTASVTVKFGRREH